MRFGHWRGVMVAVALLVSLTVSRKAAADGFHNTIPREVLAQDLSTGQPYMAPAIPWGHYAKSGLGDHFGKKCGICGLFKGKGLGKCGGHGLFGHGGGGGAGCGAGGCGDPGCGSCHGRGHAKRIKDCGLCKGKGCGICESSLAGDPMYGMASSQSPAPVVATSPQVSPMSSSQACGDPGCKLGKGHHHGGGNVCGSCGGKGCGKCGLFSGKSACGSCGGQGCGKCGLFSGKSACDSCGGKGCGKCGLFSGMGGCGYCGGKGCGFCAGLKGKIGGILHPHRGKIKYFVGPGGPVPLTPGYVPYVNPVRSPRDFLAFPPYTPDGF